MGVKVSARYVRYPVYIIRHLLKDNIWGCISLSLSQKASHLVINVDLIYFYNFLN